MEDHPADLNPSAPRDAAAWVPRDGVDSLRALVARYLDGDRRMSADAERLATDFARAARRNGESPERLLIVVRGLWRDLGLSQSDRLQVASLYEQIVRHAIEQYYGDDG